MRLFNRSCVLLTAAGIVLSAPSPSSAAEKSLVDDRPRTASTLAGMTVGANSPGVPIGTTSHDIQRIGSMGRQIAKSPGGGTVHFCWTLSPDIPTWDDQERYAAYNSWDVATGTLNQGSDGITVALANWARSGYCRIDTDADNIAHMAMHQRVEPDFPYQAWHIVFPYEGGSLHLDTELPYGPLPSREGLWPNMAIQHDPTVPDSKPIVHIISTGGYDVGGGYASIRDDIRYWRYDAAAPAPFWAGPVMVDSSRELSWVIDADDLSDRVAIAYTSSWITDGLNGRNNIAWRETQTAGLGWLDGAELGDAYKHLITAYDDTLGPRAHPYLSIAYDHSGSLHIIWTEQLVSGVPDITIRHWSDIRGTVRPVVHAHYPNQAYWYWALNLSQISLGIGDGSTLCRGGTESNEDYLYVLYLKLGGETQAEQADTSLQRRANGELYLTVSRDGGDQWSVPVNLTNTRTPDCQAVDPEVAGPGDCASEAWATLARHVDDIHIEYIMDREAGEFYTGWTINPVMYLNIAAGTTDDPYLCGLPTPVFSSTFGFVETDCGITVSPGDTISTILWIANPGDGLLEGTISVGYADSTGPVGWLTVDDEQSLAYAVPGEDSVAFTVVADADTLAPGNYEVALTLTHNDHQLLEPAVYPVRLGVGHCICHGDPQCDGVSDVLDVVVIIGVAFRSDPPVYDAICDYAQTDVTCDGITNVLDAVRMINVVFRGADAAAQFCNPCAP